VRQCFWQFEQVFTAYKHVPVLRSLDPFNKLYQRGMDHVSIDH
jgi:hypothetical protein